MPSPSDANGSDINQTGENRTYGEVAAHGMLWLAASVMLARFAALGSMWVLGTILPNYHFAVYGLAMAIWAMSGVLRGGGAAMVLIQRGKEFDALAKPVFTMALIFDIAAALLMVAIARPAAVFFEAPQLTPLLMIGALGMVLSSPVAILRAKLSIDLRFKTISRINAMSTLVRHSSLVLFAIVLPEEHKVLCFGLPLPVAAVFEILICRAATRWTPMVGGLSWTTFREIFHDARWIMLGALAVSVIMQGDKLIFGKLIPTEMFAVYFFGWQLSGAVATPVTLSLSAVLMPTLTQLSHDPDRQAAAYMKALKLLTFATSIFCIGVAVVAEPAIQFLWKEKWIEAAPVVQLLSLALVTRLLSPLGRSLVEARGRWRLRAAMLILDSAGTVAAGFIGAAMNDLQGLVLTVMIYRLIIGLVQCVIGGSTVGLSPGRILACIYPPVIVFVCVGAATFFGVDAVLGEQPAFVRLLVSAAVYGGLSLACAFTILRSRTNAMMGMVRRRPKTAAEQPESN